MNLLLFYEHKDTDEDYITNNTAPLEMEIETYDYQIIEDAKFQLRMDSKIEYEENTKKADKISLSVRTGKEDPELYSMLEEWFAFRQHRLHNAIQSILREKVGNDYNLIQSHVL